MKKLLVGILFFSFSFLSAIQPPEVLCHHRYKSEEITTSAYFAEGYDAMYKFIYKSLSWDCGNGSYQGSVVVNFTVDNVGGVWNIVVQESVVPCLDEEVVRAIRNMPNWIPATVDGVNVCSEVSVSVCFTLGLKEGCK